MQYHQNMMKNRLYQLNLELSSYWTYKIYTLTKNIDAVMKLSNRTTAVEREILNRTLYYDMTEVHNYKYNINLWDKQYFTWWL